MILFYLVVLFADFLAYVDPEASDAQRGLIAPQGIQWFHDGQFKPHVFALVGKRDPANVQARLRASIRRQIVPLTFFAPGFDYKLLRVHPGQPAPLRRAGRQPGGDALSAGHRPGRARHVVAHHVRHPHSLTIGLVGRGRQPGARRDPGRHLRLLRRHGRHGHPARDRDPALDPDDPALDGSGGGDAARRGPSCRSISRSPSSSP